MKHVWTLLFTIIVAGGMALAHSGGAQSQPGSQPQASQAPAAPGAAAQSQPAQPGQQPPAAAGQAAPAAGKPQPQAKTQEEFKAYQDAGSKSDPAEAEMAADEFAVKFPQSELKVFLYRRLMYLYQSGNNADKTLEVAKKILALDPNNPEALVTSAMVLSERTRDTDLDKDARMAEAVQDAQKAMQTIDTDLFVPANADPAQVQNIKNMLKGMAQLALGTVSYLKKDYPAAMPFLQKATELNPNDAVAWLRLSVVLDAQNKYPEAMTAVNKALEVAQPNSPEANLAKSEQARLQKLTGGAAPAPK